MKKRIRKKRHLGEFREHGFIAVGRYDTPPTPDQWDVIFDETMAFAESRNLGLTGNICGPQVDFYVCRLCRRANCLRCNRLYGRDRQRGDVTADDQAAVVAWFESRGCKVAAGPLFDAHHHSEAQFEAATPKLESA